MYATELVSIEEAIILEVKCAFDRFIQKTALQFKSGFIMHELV
jgi:hypothetical protein